MKKLIVVAALILFAGITFGQKLKKGNVIGTHSLTIELNPGVTMEQFLDFQLNTVIPEFEKHYKGWKAYVSKGLRGQNKNNYSWFFVIKSEEVRDRYYNTDGSPNELGKAANENLNSVMEESNKLGKVSRKYTDWLIL